MQVERRKETKFPPHTRVLHAIAHLTHTTYVQYLMNPFPHSLMHSFIHSKRIIRAPTLWLVQCKELMTQRKTEILPSSCFPSGEELS